MLQSTVKAMQFTRSTYKRGHTGMMRPAVSYPIAIQSCIFKKSVIPLCTFFPRYLRCSEPQKSASRSGFLVQSGFFCGGKIDTLVTTQVGLPSNLEARARYCTSTVYVWSISTVRLFSFYGFSRPTIDGKKNAKQNLIRYTVELAHNNINIKRSNKKPNTSSLITAFAHGARPGEREREEKQRQ